MIKIPPLLTAAALAAAVLPQTAAAQEPVRDVSQDLSMSVGKAEFIKLPNTSRTKPNFLDMGLDMLLQKALANVLKEGVTVTYSFLEFIPADKTVVLTDLKIDSKRTAFKGTISFGTLKIGMQDFVNSLKVHSLSFSQINGQNVRLKTSVFAGKTEKERLNGMAKTLQITNAVYGPCTADFEQKLTGNETNEAVAGRCITAQQVFALDGYLIRGLKKEKYTLKEGLINAIQLRLDSPEAPLLFSVGSVNGKTVRTPAELFQALKQ